MRFVAANISLPVPKVFCSFLHKDRAYIVMERIQGEPLPRAWKTLPEESRQEIFRQLKTLIQELRLLNPPDRIGVASCIGGIVREARIPRPLPRMGPFGTIQEFHLFLKNNLHPQNVKGKNEDEDW